MSPPPFAVPMVPSTSHRLLLLPLLSPQPTAAATSCARRHASLFSSSSSPSIRTPKPHSSSSQSSSTVNPEPDPPSPTVTYLVASCGLSPDAAALLASQKFRIRSTPKADAVLSLLRSYGFSDAQISKIARGRPQLLGLDPDKILKPKLDFLVGLGFSGPSLAKLLTWEPTLLGCSLEKHLVPCVHFLRGILGTDANIVAAVSRVPRAFHVDLDKVMRPAVEALRRHGLPEETISQLVLMQPYVLTLAPGRIDGIIEDLRAAGLQLSDEKRFLRCFCVLCHFKRERWERKIAFYKSFGLSESEVFKAFRRQPTIMNLSEEKIEKKVRFFLDKLKLDLADIVACPSVLSASLENTILPRCAVLSVLMREGKIRQPLSGISGPFRCNSKVFLERYVSRYQHDVPDVLRAYEGKIEFQGFEGSPLKESV